MSKYLTNRNAAAAREGEASGQKCGNLRIMYACAYIGKNNGAKIDKPSAFLFFFWYIDV